MAPHSFHLDYVLMLTVAKAGAWCASSCTLTGVFLFGRFRPCYLANFAANEDGRARRKSTGVVLDSLEEPEQIERRRLRRLSLVGRCKLTVLLKPVLLKAPRVDTGAKAESWCLLIHADASVSLSVLEAPMVSELETIIS